MAVDNLVVELSDCIVCALRTIGLVVFPVVADESEGLLISFHILSLHHNDAGNFTVLAEEILELLSGVVRVEFLDVDVVEDLSDFSWVFRLVSDDL